MKILFIYQSAINPIKGGVQRVTFTLGNIFEEMGHDVIFLSFKETKDGGRDPRQVFLPDRTKVDSIENIIWLRELLISRGIDVIINQDGFSANVLRLISLTECKTIKRISVLHNSPLASVKNYRYSAFERFEKRHLAWLLPLTDISIIKKTMLKLYQLKYVRHFRNLCAQSDNVILLSDSFKEELSFYFNGICPSNVISIPNPVSFRGDGVSQGNKKKEILFVGRIDFSQKRVDLLLKIWEKTYRDFPDWTLRIVGGGAKLNDAKKIVSDLNIQRVCFEGFQNPISYYQSASILCMTSSFEGFSLTLIEGMQMECVPVVFESYSSVTDVIQDGVNGLLVKAFDLDEYVEKLKSLMRNKNLMEKMSANAVEKSNEYSAENIGRKWINLLTSSHSRLR